MTSRCDQKYHSTLTTMRTRRAIGSRRRPPQDDEGAVNPQIVRRQPRELRVELRPRQRRLVPPIVAPRDLLESRSCKGRADIPRSQPVGIEPGGLKQPRLPHAARKAQRVQARGQVIAEVDLMRRDAARLQDAKNL